MDRDHSDSRSNSQDDSKNTPSKENPEPSGKSVGCSSLMMKNFESSASLLKLGMGRTTTSSPAKATNSSAEDGVNDDSLSMFLSSTIQTNQHSGDVHRKLKDPQGEYALLGGNSTSLNNIKNTSLVSKVTNNRNGPMIRTRRSSGLAPEFESVDVLTPPYKNHLTMGNYSPCPLLGKQMSPMTPGMGRSYPGLNHTGMSNSTRAAMPMMHTYFAQGSEERYQREIAENTTSFIREGLDDKNTVTHEESEENKINREGSEANDHSNTSQYYSTVFDNSDETLSLLKKMFAATSTTNVVGDSSNELGEDSEDPGTQMDKFEWIPNEPTQDNMMGTKEDIEELFENNFEEDCDGYMLSSYFNNAQTDLDTKLMNLSSIHESLYTNSDTATLRTLEKFLLQLLQQKNFYGSLTPFGKLLAFINLSFLKKHITLLDSLYSHPEMSVIRSVIANSRGQIEKTLNTSAGIEGNKLSSEETINVFTQILNKTNRDKNDVMTLANTLKSKQYSSGFRQNRNRLTVIDTLSGMYKPGGEPHFPRFVCGSVDRSRVVSSETISIPFEKSDKRNVHVQFEKFDNEHCKAWPNTTKLPQNISEGTFVQVAPQKHASTMAWKGGMVVSISSGQLMIKVPNEPKERMYIMRNFVPPNVPIVKLEKGHWRLMPRELDVTRDLYVGSCLSLLDLPDPEESVDVVVLNMFFSSENTPIAPVKLPSDETNFQHESKSRIVGNNTSDPGASQLNSNRNENAPIIADGLDDMIIEEILDETDASDIETGTKKSYETDMRMCSCSGHTLRVFEGRCAGVPERILVHNLHDKKEHVLTVADLKGFKLNYDIHAHFDGPTGNAQFPNSVWVIPRDISFLGDTLATKDSQKAGYSWLFKPAYCLVMFPFNRTVDTLQDLFRLIPFLHPELNYLALCAGMWSLRNKPEARGCEAVSYTRSQKAAIRDLTSNDVVSEVCADLVRCPFSLTRRLYGCLPVISLWITMDLYDPDSDKEPSIPNNIKVPKPTACENCTGLVLSKTGMVKIISNKYTQMLAKKLARRSRDTGTNNTSMETLPQLDSESSKKGQKEGSDTDKDASFEVEVDSKLNEEQKWSTDSGLTIGFDDTSGGSTSFGGSRSFSATNSTSVSSNRTTGTSVSTKTSIGSSSSSTGVNGTDRTVSAGSVTSFSGGSGKTYTNAITNTTDCTSTSSNFGSGSPTRSPDKTKHDDSRKESIEKQDEGERLGDSNLEELSEESTLRKEMEELSRSLNSKAEESVLANLDQTLTMDKAQESNLFSAIFSSDAEYDVTPVLMDLERAEEWVKRVQTLANSRWRVTKEFTASYTVDDEFSLLTMSPTASANKPNSEFIIQLAGVMNTIKKGKDTPIDPTLVYKLYQLSEECSSTTEGALLTGWSSYIFNEQKSHMDLLISSNVHNPRPSISYSNNLRREKEAYQANMCPFNPNCPRGINCPSATGLLSMCPHSGPSIIGASHQGYGGTYANSKHNFAGSTRGSGSNAFQKYPSTLSSNYSRLFNNSILTDLSNYYKRKRDDDIRRLTAFNKMQKNNHASGSIMPKLGLQADMNLLKTMNKNHEKDNPFINDPFDFCKFNDKPQRKKFISSLNWDEDVEF
ncbi:hypothetical protein MACK_000371 [Theileria orientalis]|uniref:Uncharacterized protein n=1 Tax=Theileria orientalis TaxID=68886 RepID=A0A976MBZ8_THEOR|nr:hypothetical protein MACK_000371 [Theileria orientalis]